MSQDRIVVALAASDAEANHATLEQARRRGFVRFCTVDPSLGPPLPGETWYRATPDELLALSPSPVGTPAAVRLFRIRDPAELVPVVTALERGDPVAVRWSAERVIPLESLVAARRRVGTLWVVTAEGADVPAFLGALEHGADTVVVEIASPDLLEDLENRLDQVRAHLAWERVRVESASPAGMGDRVIVDTTSLLSPEEGLLVGSTAALLFHVASEAEGSRYTRPRPFRVNAGAAHSYTLLANGETRYLSELVAGDAVLVCTPEGTARSVRVGRVKIERRPLTLVVGEYGRRRPTVFLQQAETVRLSTTTGRAPTTELHAGVLAWAVALSAGRHLGKAVEESIEER